MIRVLVWAKPAVTRAGLEAIVQADSRFKLAGEGSRPADLLTAMRHSAPDIVLFDAGKSPLSSLPAGPHDSDVPMFAVLMESPRRIDVLRALQAGVRGVLARDAHPHEITAALQAIHDGLTVFSVEILEVLLPASTELVAERDLPPGEPLSDRESHVLSLMAEGAGNKEIATRLGISEHTVKFHVSSILSKLGAATRTEAVTRGYKEGLILM